MKKLLIPFLFIGYAICVQSCKKSTTDYVTTYRILSASINSVSWVPDTVTAAITYNSAANTRTFSCVGTYDQKQVFINLTQRGGATSTGYPLGTYTIDSTNVILTYSVQQKDSNGAYVFVQQGVVHPGSGYVTISSVDTVAKKITGLFKFTPKNVTYDSNGNVSSIKSIIVSGGSFYNLPYTFKRN